MTNSIVPFRELNPGIWEMIKAVAPSMKESRLFGVSTESQAIAVMAKGYELGLSLTASFEFLQVIEGRPALIPRGALALILNSPLLEKLEIRDGNGECTVVMKRRGGLEYTARYSLKDAERAGLVKDGSGWAKYPENMMRWRAIGFCADVVFPDVLGGIKRADELGADLSPEGEVIDGDWNAIGSQPPATGIADPSHMRDVPAPAQPAQNAATEVADPMTILNDLVLKYGAEEVIRANAGSIPATLDQIHYAAGVLREGL